jgi:hypothetical protein
MKVLILGATGFVGRNALAQALARPAVTQVIHRQGETGPNCGRSSVMHMQRQRRRRSRLTIQNQAINRSLLAIISGSTDDPGLCLHCCQPQLGIHFASDTLAQGATMKRYQRFSADGILLTAVMFSTGQPGAAQILRIGELNAQQIQA